VINKTGRIALRIAEAILVGVFGTLIYVFVFRAPRDADGCRGALAASRTHLDTLVARSHSISRDSTCGDLTP
jgi:hypothetical protein